MIALFDSGLGGLSILREVRALLPTHDLLYVADTAFCPYGPRPVAWVRRRSLAVGRWLAVHGAEVLVVACNTATSAALEALRSELPIPVVGMEPGVKPAAAVTRTGRVAVLATAGTLAGRRLATLIERFAGEVEVLTQPCPGWVELVERGTIGGDEARAVVARSVEPLLQQGADALVLGCTHFPFLRPVIADVAGPGVTIVDTGPAVARQVVRVAERQGVLGGGGRITYLTTGDPASVEPALRRLLAGADVVVERAVLAGRRVRRAENGEGRTRA